MHHHWVMKRRGALTWSSQSRRGVACVSTQTPAWPAGRAGLWGEGWGQVDRPRARAGCWPLTRTAEGRRVCQALQMNPRRYLQRNKTTKKLKKVTKRWGGNKNSEQTLYSACTTSVCQMLILTDIFYQVVNTRTNTDPHWKILSSYLLSSCVVLSKD